MELIPVQSECVDIIWPRVLPLVEKACAKGPTRDLDPEDLRGFCIAGLHQLWIVSDGSDVQVVGITGFNVSGERPVCEWIAFASEVSSGWQEYMAPIENWAKQQGCEVMRSYSRPGMKKQIPKEYRVKGIIYEKALV